MLNPFLSRGGGVKHNITYMTLHVDHGIVLTCRHGHYHNKGLYTVSQNCLHCSIDLYELS